MKTINLDLTPYFRTALSDGSLVPDAKQHMTTEDMYYAHKGDVVSLMPSEYLFSVALYSSKRSQELIYTYCYAKESNWVTYTQNVTPEGYSSDDYAFEEDCFFRVCVKRKDGGDITDTDICQRTALIRFRYDDSKDTLTGVVSASIFEKECKDTVDKLAKENTDNQFRFILLTDSHFAVNGTWDQTAANMKALCQKVPMDAVIHLGDLTDGMLSKESTSGYVRHMITGMEEACDSVYLTLGNHDNNYFRNKGREFSQDEIRRLYSTYSMRQNACFQAGEIKSTYAMDYFVDLYAGEGNLRMIFLESFADKRPVRYGYDEVQIDWAREVMLSAPKGTRFIIFTHDAPLAELDYWSFHIHKGIELVALLDEINGLPDYQVVGLFYGHTHADFVCEKASFPMISICCNKLEYFLDKKPEGCTVPERQEDNASQECFDCVAFDFGKELIKLTRFGAGDDREVSFAKGAPYSKYLAQEKANRIVKIWAHRGACGHAPENTLPSFALAVAMGADGIELDVQYTKDRQLVVIHDEKVDRTTDGTGFVKDFTLEELKKLNANKSFPSYGFTEIPTLREVYELVRDTDLYINLELKNSVIFYEGLEEDVLSLAKEMGMEDRLIYSSFNHYSMRRIKAINPESKIAFLYSNGIMDIDEYGKKYGVDAVHPSLGNMRYPDCQIVKDCHEKGIEVNVWTANEPGDIAYLKKLGVDAIITNYIERCK